MAFAFICPQCGKQFEVSESLAGKRGKCKQCGALFRIPSPEHSPNYQVPAPDPYAFSNTPSPRVDDRTPSPDHPPAYHVPAPDPYAFAKTPSPKVDDRKAPPRIERDTGKPKPVSSAPPKPVVDPYGLEDSSIFAPVPPQSESDFENDAPVSPLPPKKKKKSVGFFGAKKASRQSSTSSSNRGVQGLSLGGVITVVLIVVRLVINHGGLLGLSSRSALEQFCERDVQFAENVTEQLKTIHDVGSANEAAPKIVSLIHGYIQLLREIKNKKALIKDINEVKAKFKPRQERAAEDCVAQFNRVALIPGAKEALMIIQGPLDEMMAMQQSLGGNNSNDNTQPSFGPMFRPPIRPNFPAFAPPTPQPVMIPNPPMMPQPPAPMVPNGPRFGRPGFPGPQMGPPGFRGPRMGPRFH